MTWVEQKLYPSHLKFLVMSKLNPKRESTPPILLAGGLGAQAARQTPEQTLRRMVMASLLWEDLAYVDGVSAADRIAELIPQVPATIVGSIALEARQKQKLRHTPLFILREMLRHDGYKQLVGALLPQICTRADMLSDFLALYWKDGKIPLAKQLRKGLSAALKNFDEYQLAKYDRSGQQVRLRDVLFLARPKPDSIEQEALWQRLADRQLATPDTWEVALSTGEDKCAAWTRLIGDRQLGALAFLRNLRNMVEVGVDPSVIQHGFDTIKPGLLLPLNFFNAVQHAPAWTRQIEDLMLRAYADLQKLPGWTIFVVDVSGSMAAQISKKSQVNRLDVAVAMATLAAETCQRVSIYATAGNDGTCVHATKAIPNYRGFGLAEAIKSDRLGSGGIFTRQCLEYIRQHQTGTPDRIIVFSDSQDCDRRNSASARPFGKNNYIIDVSAHAHGIAHQGLWTAEISGWSEHFLTYIRCIEGLDNVVEV